MGLKASGYRSKQEGKDFWSSVEPRTRILLENQPGSSSWCSFSLDGAENQHDGVGLFCFYFLLIITLDTSFLSAHQSDSL